MAGLSFAVVDPVKLLEPTGLSIRPSVVLQRGAVVLDGFSQGGSDRPEQAPGLFGIERVGPGDRMKPCSMQHFIAVDVAQPGDRMLIQEEGLELSLATQDSAKVRGRHLQGFETQLGKGSATVALPAAQAPYSAETARVDKAQLARGSGNRDAKMGMGFDRLPSRANREPTAHAQMEDELGLRLKLQDDSLAAPMDALDPPTGKRSRKRPRITVYDIAASKPHIVQPSAGKTAIQLACDRLRLG